MKVLILILAAMVLVGCTPDVENIKNCLPQDDISGFWSGLWHGIIIMVSFVISLFSDNTVIYDVNNSGGWYNFGFMLGAGVFSSGCSKCSK